MKKMLIIQNDVDEGPGLFLKEMELAGVAPVIVHPYKGEAIPRGERIESEDFRALMVLGGPMNALDDQNFPFLKDEVRLIQDFLERKLPILNICLGSQLLARACDMPIKLAGDLEIGWKPIQLTEWYTKRNPLFFQMDLKPMVFHWHTDTFEVPSEAYPLARSDMYEYQAFCYGGNAYGLQFHPEVTQEMVETWIKKGVAHGDIDQSKADQILVDTGKEVKGLQKIAHQIFYGFATLLREPHYRRPAVEPASEKLEEAPVEASTSEGTTQQEAS
jgi:GMP synthase (glutamine-hydrolysing)